MKKFKRLLALMLIVAMLPITGFAQPMYNKYSNSLEWSITVTDATTQAATFETMAFKVTIEGEKLSNGEPITANIIKQEDPFKNPMPAGAGQTTYFYRCLISNEGADPNAPSLYKSFSKKYSGNDEAMKIINKRFQEGLYAIIDSVVIIKHYGEYQGEVNADGYPIKSKKGDKVFDNPIGFGHAEDWSQGTQNTALNMFNIRKHFERNPIDPPKATITRGMSDKVTSYEEYTQGEVIDLTGRTSWFPAGESKQYKWEYRKKGESSWLSGGNRVTIDIKNPELGEYETKLTTFYEAKVAWKADVIRKTCEKPAEATIKIKASDKTFASAQLSAPPDILLEKNQSQVSVPVTLTSTLQNMDLANVVKVDYVIQTEDGFNVYKNSKLSTLGVNETHNFLIHYSGTPFTQNFKGQATYTLTDGSKVKSDFAFASTYIRRKGDGNMPPVPILKPIQDVVVGTDIYLNGAQSYDPDGEVVSWQFLIPRWGFSYSEDGHKTAFKIAPEVGQRFQAILGVTDNDGAYSETDQFFNVVYPRPSLNLSVGGWLKENRKVILKADVYNPGGYTTREDQVQWSVKPLDGQSKDGIKFQSSTGRNINTLFREKGSYLVECTATNNANMSETAQLKINISEDLVPETIIDVQETQYRDQEGKAIIKAYDNSNSIDADFIETRVWSYVFDSDNDGDFNDETKTAIKTATLPEDNFVEIPANHVGRYRIYLDVKEGFGQETLPEFISASDYKQAMTSVAVEMDNRKPVVAFTPIKMKKVDLTIATDYTGDKLTALGDKLNKYIANSYDNYLDVKLNFITDTKHLGRYLPEGINAGGFDLVEDSTSPKYQVARWGPLTEWSDHSYAVTYTTKHLRTNTTTETQGIFPAAIKDSYTYNSGQATIWLLENGDVYFIGTNSINSAGFYSSESIFATKPIKILSDIKQIDGNTEIIYLLSGSGGVYVIGGEFKGATQGGVFDTYYNQYDLSAVIPFVDDTAGYSRLYNYYTSGTFTGNTSAISVNGLSNITYIWSDGSALVARTNTGAWYGFGKGLNGFGLSTGFNNSPPGTVSSWDKLSAKDSYNMLHQLDNTNRVTYLKNLSDLDAKVGGIEKVTPNYAYAKNGDKYTFKETPTVLFGHQRYTAKEDIPKGATYSTVFESPKGYTPYEIEVMYPFQINDSKFEYSKVGTWTEEKTWYKTTRTLVEDSDFYLNPISIVTENFSINATEHITSWSSQPSYTELSQTVYSGITDYSTSVATRTIYSYQGSTYDPKLVIPYRSDKGGFVNNFIKKTYTSQIAMKSVAGKKVYGIKLDNYPTTAFRDNSKKYLFYLGNDDSFNKIPKTIGDFVTNKQIDVKISTKASYIDGAYDKASEINLRQLSIATPNGKIYAEDAIDAMLADVTAENQVARKGDDGLYLIKGEEEATYLTYYADLENDPKLSQVFNHIQDEKYFENGEGVSQYHNIQRTEPVKAFDKVGKYRVFHKATDQPTKEVPFQEYNRESDVAEATVYVHRRPIADFDLIYKYNQTDINISTDNRSYDLDHKSKSDKGITASAWKWRLKTDTTWKTGYPTSLKYGDVAIVYLEVTDYEGATSSTQKTFTMLSEPPFLFGAVLVPEKSENSLTAFPRGQNVKWISTWTQYPYSHHLETALYDGTTQIAPTKTINYTEGSTATYDNTTGKNNWFDILYNIPATVLAKTYKMVIKAISDVDSTKTKTIEVPITVIANTPPTVGFTSTTPTSPYEGDSIISTVLPKDADGDKLKLDYYLWREGESEKLIQSYSNTTQNVLKTLPSFIGEKEGLYYQKVIVTDPSGASATTTKSIWVNRMGVSAVITPNDPMSGDKLYFNVSTTGYVDFVEIIPEQSWIENDKRVTMGYKPAAYQNGTANGGYKALVVNMDQSQLNDTKMLEYIVWVSTPQSVTLKKKRLREPYTITLRAWKGSVHRDETMTLDLEGTVLETLKMGTPNK